MLVDTHAHLTFEQFDRDRPEAIARACSHGVGLIIEIGTDLEQSRRAVALAGEHEAVFATVGVHPHDALTLDGEALEALRVLAKAPKVVGIGETGLDFHRNLSPPAEQARAFAWQIRLAHDLDLPLVVHVRDAHEDALSLLRQEGVPPRGAVLHCFSGSVDIARQAIDLGLHIAVGGPLTYARRNAREPSRLFRVVQDLPPERLLLETDSPYLPPTPLRGTRNEPANLRYIAAAMAEALRLSREDIERITRLNAQQLFRIGSPDAGQIAYPIRNSLYLNITNRCTNSCTFCVRNRTDFVKGHNLRLDHEPSYEEVIAAIKDPSAYVEVVFCGIGEPLLRLDLVKAVAIWLKKRGARVRLNTNGQGNLIWKRDIIPELVGLIDEVSVSLNAPTAEIYEQLCPSQFGPGTFASVKDFVRQAARLLPKVSVTAVAVPGLDISACRDVAQKELGVPLRVRAYNVVG